MNLNETKNSYQNSVNTHIEKGTSPNGWTSWPVIIILCIVFWPVGIFLIWKRISVDKTAALVSGKLVSIIGWVSISFAALGFFVSLSEGFGSDDISMIAFFLIAGIVLIGVSKKIRNSAQKYKKYISIVVNQEITAIDNIAASVSTTYDTAKKDLQKMIDKGYFDGAYIDENAREIVLPKMHIESINNEVNNVIQNIQKQVVICKSCGANNQIVVGTVGECEYCGAHIEIK